MINQRLSIVRLLIVISTIFYFMLINSISFSQDEIILVPQKITDNIYMIKAGGGNVSVCIGDDGTFLVDDLFAELNPMVVDAVNSIGGKEIKFIINTHYHGDHTGGNEPMGKLEAIIIAHDNVRKKLSVEQVIDYTNSKRPPMPKNGLPVLTFTRDIKMYFNNEEINIIHYGSAHTDGDAVVYFNNSNVLHTGDLFFENIYPFVDLQNGGSVVSLLEVLSSIKKIINQDTKIIPGHGKITDYDGFLAYCNMISTIFNRVEKMVSEGKSIEEIIASKLTKEFDEKYDNRFTPSANFISFIYDSLK